MGEDFQHSLRPFAARHAFTTGFIPGKLHKEAGYLHHTIILIKDHQPSRTHDRSCGGQGFIIYTVIQVFLGEASTRRATYLHCLERLTGRDPTADIIDKLAYGEAQGDFNQSSVGYFSSQSKSLGPRVGGGTEATKPICSI